MSEYDKLKGALPGAISRADVGKVLRAVISDREPWDWFTQARIPFPFAVAILRALRDAGYVQFEPTALTASGRALAAELGVSATPDLTCPTCRGSGIIWRGFEGVYEAYLEVFDSRPRSEDPDLDQGAMTPQSLFRRIALMVSQGDVAGREIVALGDDDLASVALALTGLPAGVTVLEIDPRICDYISRVAGERGLKIQVRRQDLTALLPEDLRGRMDTFVCDPPETEEGLLLFVEKGLALLKAGDAHTGYFGATVLEASASKWRRWQSRLLREAEIAFTHILQPFTEYESWPDERALPDLPPLAAKANKPWYRFAFYRIETLPGFTPVPDFEVEHSRVFYFDEESYYEAFK